jgi:hypothetical protein
MILEALHNIIQPNAALDIPRNDADSLPGIVGNKRREILTPNMRENLLDLGLQFAIQTRALEFSGAIEASEIVEKGERHKHREKKLPQKGTKGSKSFWQVKSFLWLLCFFVAIFLCL